MRTALAQQASSQLAQFGPRGARRRSAGGRAAATVKAAADRSHETDVVVIGAGIGGLCAAAMAAKYGLKVTVCESHSIPGGAAHSWERDGYTFESGPSLYSGMAARPTTNPIGQVLHALDETLPVIEYNTWICHFPEASFLTEVGNDQFLDVLRKYYGDDAAREWIALKQLMRPLARASTAVPSAAVRTDAAALFTLGRFLPKLILGAPLETVQQIMQPYSEVIKGKIKHPFILRYMDMLCFLLSGAPASGTMAAEIGFMFDDWFKPRAMLEFPVGGSGAIIQALVRGLEKNGGRLELRAHVEEVLVEGSGERKRAAGVRLRDGSVVRARRAVISNATVWDTAPLLPEGAVPNEWLQQQLGTKQCESFVHLHLGIDAKDLPKDLNIHHISIEDWERGVTAPMNLVLVSIPSVLDPSMAPPGKHVIHAYYPGTEPYDVWEGLDRKSPEYARLKEERSQALWRAVEKIIPDVRRRAEVVMVGTPLTQARFLRRDRGTYGGTGWIGAGGMAAAPSPVTPLNGLLLVGDSTFPGPGVPAVAAGGMGAAHALVPFWKHCETLDVVCPR